MVPPRALSRRQRDADYSNVGVAGRKTGVMLKDTGVRDEHGLEPIDGIFSSLEKPANAAKRNSNVTLTDEEMEMGHTSTIAEPTELLSARRPRLPPPRSRSPIKTSLGSSPRRSIGQLRSPMRLRNGSQRPIPSLTSRPARAVPAAPQLSSDQPLEAAHASPSSAAVARKRGRKPKNKDPRSIEPASPSTSAALGDISGVDEIKTASIGPPNISFSLTRLNGSASPDMARFDTRGLRKSPTLSTAFDEVDVVEETVPALPVKSKRGRPKKAVQRAQAIGLSVMEATDDVSSTTAKSMRSRTAAALREPGTEVGEGPPKLAKRAKLTRAIERREVKEKPPPSQRHPRAIVKSKAGQGESGPSPIPEAQGQSSMPPPPPKRDQAQESGPHRAVHEVRGRARSASHMSPSARSVAASANDLGKPKPRSLAILRGETPQDAARFTKSGRTSVRPCAYWRNERVVYGDSTSDGQRLLLPGIKEIIRTDEEEPQRQKATRKRGSKRKVIEDVNDSGKPEKWERDPGMLVGEIRPWDPYEEKAIEDETEQIEMAVAPKGFQGLLKEVKNQNFHYAKLVALPFFHSGMLDIPPGGQKRYKNSRRNHMAFWVFSGRVEVRVSESEFRIGRGGMWQVPRGNFYSIENPYSYSSRIFFAQGSYMTEAEVELGDEVGSGDGKEVGEGEGPLEEE